MAASIASLRGLPEAATEMSQRGVLLAGAQESARLNVLRLKTVGGSVEKPIGKRHICIPLHPTATYYTALSSTLSA